MNIQLLPDLIALVVLLVVLFFLRRRHPHERVELWLIGLLFIFIEGIAHAFYRPSGPTHIPSHIVALDAYLAAGVIFLWAAATSLYSRAYTLRYLLLNTPLFAALLTTYALDVRKPLPYQIISAAGLALGIASPFLITRTLGIGPGWWLLVPQAAIWIPAFVFAAHHQFRDSAYFPLFILYFTAGFIFQRSLPPRSLGKICIVAGLVIWSLVFLFHSWVTDHPQYIDLAAQVWNMQKFLVMIGMLLVILELRVSSSEWYALHDQLTGLPNRRYFEDRLPLALEHAERTGTRVALIMLDLNGFKGINDSLGHDTGDRLLQHIAYTLRQTVRKQDFLARLGGDEFILLTSDLSPTIPASNIAQVAHDRIAEALQKPFHTGAHHLNISGSIGVALYPDDATDEVLLRRLADQRMYAQKRQIPLHLEPQPLA